METSAQNDLLEKTIIPQKRGRITIPVEFRRKLGIDDRTPLRLKLQGEVIQIQLAPKVEEKHLLRDFSREDVLSYLEMEIIKQEDYEQLVKTIRIAPKQSPIPRLFLDTSVLVAALGPKPNYSRLIPELCRAGKVQSLLTEVIIRETEQVVHDVMDEEALAKLYAMLAELDAEIIPLPRAKVIDMVDQAIKDKHSHVVSSAWAGGANYLLSLNRTSFLRPEQRQAALPLKVHTPREFILDRVSIEGR